MEIQEMIDSTSNAMIQLKRKRDTLDKQIKECEERIAKSNEELKKAYCIRDEERPPGRIETLTYTEDGRMTFPCLFFSPPPPPAQ